MARLRGECVRGAGRKPEGMSKGAAVAGGERGKGMGCGSRRGSPTPLRGGP